jgi:hypothetical protein
LSLEVSTAPIVDRYEEYTLTIYNSEIVDDKTTIERYFPKISSYSLIN